jgi:hypothetical protein
MASLSSDPQQFSPVSLDEIFRRLLEWSAGNSAHDAFVRAMVDGTLLRQWELSPTAEFSLRVGPFLRDLAQIQNPREAVRVALHVARMGTMPPPAPSPEPVVAVAPRTTGRSRVRVLGLATLGLLSALTIVLGGTALAVQMGWTRESNHLVAGPQIALVQSSPGQDGDAAMDSALHQQLEVRQGLQELRRRHPATAAAIWKALQEHGDGAIVTNMVRQARDAGTKSQGASAYAWQSEALWDSTQRALERDLPLLAQVSQETGVSMRLLALPALCEQLRRSESFRQTYKTIFSRFIPLRGLSAGVTGIKVESMERIKKQCAPRFAPFLTDSALDSLPGRLATDNGRWAYLYAAIYLDAIQTTWKNAGYDLTLRPEITLTIYNLGLDHCPPRDSAQEGGANFRIGSQEFTFGSFAREFYWSGILYPELTY